MSRDAHGLLVRALQQRAGGPGRAGIGAARSEAWASATFRGARHDVALRLVGEDARERAGRLAAEMEGLEFDLPGHLVADISVTAREDDADGVSLRVEALTVEEA